MRLLPSFRLQVVQQILHHISKNTKRWSHYCKYLCTHCGSHPHGNFDQQIGHWAELQMHFEADIYCTFATLEQLVQGSLHLLHAAVHLFLLLAASHGLKHFGEVFRTVIERIFNLPESNKQLAMVFESFVQDPKCAVSNHNRVGGIVRFPLSDALPHRVLMLLLMLLQIAHIQVLLVAPLDLAYIPPASFLVFQVNLHVLLQVCSCREGLTALLTNEGLLLGVDASMAVEVRLLVELLIALVEVAFIGPGASMDQLVSLQSRTYIELTLAIINITPVLTVLAFLVVAGRDADVEIFMAGHAVIVLRRVLFTSHVAADGKSLLRLEDSLSCIKLRGLK